MTRSVRARRALWLALLLPTFVLRSLIPMGFMPMFGPGFSVGIMLCDGYAPVPDPPMAMDMPMRAGMAMPMDAAGQSGEPQRGDDRSGRGSPAQQNHSACPYGASSVFAGAPALAAVGLALERSLEPVLPAPQLAVFPTIARAQSPGLLRFTPEREFQFTARCRRSTAPPVVCLASRESFSWVHVYSRRYVQWRSAVPACLQAAVLGSVHVTVRDAQDQPLAGAQVKIKSASAAWTRSATTNRGVKRYSRRCRSVITRSASASQALLWTHGRSRSCLARRSPPLCD